jgi:hypothetical protein
MPKFTSGCAGKQTSAHPNPAVNTPAINCHTRFRKRALPRKDVRINCINKGSIKIKNQCSHIYIYLHMNFQNSS